MERLSISEIISLIELEETFDAVSEDYSFTLKIDSYVHYVCAAIHDGHQFRKSLWSHCSRSEYERWFEEDPATKQMVHSFPIVISGCDSRFEYDLNRCPENAIYDDAWGKQLWKRPINNKEKELSLKKHSNFYKVLNTLINKLESMFKSVCVYDFHSYNWKRWKRDVPTFNIGASNIDMVRFGDDVENWRIDLAKLKLPHNMQSISLINDTFKGNGYLLKYITSNFKNTLVLATEIKKIYCDENLQIVYPEVVDAIESELNKKLKNHALSFYNNHSN